MFSFVLPLLQPTQPAGPGFAGFLPIIAIVLIFYFLIIRPQSKKRKETEKMLSALKKGDRIITIGGLYGTIHTLKESTVIIKVDDNVKLEFLRSAISTVTIPAPAKEEKVKENKKEEKIEEESSESTE
ncbi:MAG: preprotein translocase subunit YajC [Treponema sp.]|nr:preprotein translocase subunit YajC [Treponema sp.]